MSKANLHSEILQAITDRSVWEQRQLIWYQMRHDGRRRQKKPYAGAADLHFPIIDTAIEKLKPFYYSQVYGGNKLSQFVAMREQLADVSEAASDALDWKLREETNLGTEILSCIDYMLMRGRGILKFWWDVDEGRIRFDAIDPVYLLVPYQTNRLCDAPWICEVRQLSVLDYKMAPDLEQDPEVIQKIRGGESKTSMGSTDQEKSNREGITFSQKKDTIILWEVYKKVRTESGEIGWNVYTYSPNDQELKIKEPYRLSTEFKGKPVLPYVEFPMEVKDKGYYASRGVSERLAAHEAWACKIWNAKADLIDFTSKPMFTTDNPLSNTGNISFAPGEILSGGLQAVQLAQPPINLDNELGLTRQVAEQSIMMPDFGVGGQEGSQGSNKTATEVDYIRTLSSTGVDLKGRMFRLGFQDLLRGSWALLLQHAGQEISYFIADTCKKLPAEALHDQYWVIPDGTPDQWNKINRVQRAMQRLQVLKGHPNISQEELVREFLVADDARLVYKLFIPTNEKAASESKDEALEVLLLMAGYPVQSRPEQDHVTRIKILFGKLEQMAQTGAEVDPIAKQRLQEHIAQHVQLLKQQNPTMAKQLTQGLMAAEQQIPQQPQNVIQGPGQGGISPQMGAFPSAGGGMPSPMGGMQ